MDNQVKELASVIAKRIATKYTGNAWEDAAEAAIEWFDSHPSSQSLKRISDEEMKVQIMRLFDGTFCKWIPENKPCDYIFKNDSLTCEACRQEQAEKLFLAADQLVVAELEMQIAKVKKENAEVRKQANEGADIISHQMDEIKALKAQLQPVPDEKLEEKLKDIILKACLHFANGDEEQIHGTVKSLSALIKSREGKVAGEIKKVLSNLDPYSSTMALHAINLYEEQSKAHYSPESE